MFEPRTAHDLIDRFGLKFLGGVERFDLWYMTSNTRPFDEYRLRIHVVGGNVGEWDVFKLPLRDNEKNSKIIGNWGDVPLIPEEVDLIETYLRFFVPWVLGSNLTEENNNE